MTYAMTFLLKVISVLWILC